jgi:RNA polymerase sigma factor (sigma-70 family)
MAQGLSDLLGHIRHLVGGQAAGEPTDGQLLERFAARHDADAFALLMRRHAGLVWGVCRRILGHVQDAEDVFQATFLALVRQAGSVARGESVGGWLYRVAYRIAMKAKHDAARRAAGESRAEPPQTPGPDADVAWAELRLVLDEELNRLPEKYRSPFVLCCLLGRTQTEAARELGWTKGTVSGRLARARDVLRQRLTRRGLTLAAGLVGSVLSVQASAETPRALAEATLKALLPSALGGAAGMVSARVAELARGGLQTMFAAKMRIVALVLALSVLAGGMGVLTRPAASGTPPGAKPAEGPRQPEADAPKAPPADRQGDPLPPGASARLGTVRLRHQRHRHLLLPGRQAACLGGQGPYPVPLGRGHRQETPPVRPPRGRRVASRLLAGRQARRRRGERRRHGDRRRRLSLGHNLLEDEAA